MAKPRIPAGLGAAGRALWRDLSSGVGGREIEFSRSELVALQLACRQADDLAALEQLLGEQGLIVAGSQGQQRLSTLPTEIRLQRFALNRLVASLALPADDEVQGLNPSQVRAQNAAETRWAEARRRREQREAGNG